MKDPRIQNPLILNHMTQNSKILGYKILYPIIFDFWNPMPPPYLKPIPYESKTIPFYNEKNKFTQSKLIKIQDNLKKLKTFKFKIVWKNKEIQIKIYLKNQNYWKNLSEKNPI